MKWRFIRCFPSGLSVIRRHEMTIRTRILLTQKGRLCDFVISWHTPWHGTSGFVISLNGRLELDNLANLNHKCLFIVTISECKETASVTNFIPFQTSKSFSYICASYKMQKCWRGFRKLHPNENIGLVIIYSVRLDC